MSDDKRAKEVLRMRRAANDWRRPELRQVEGPNDLKIYGGTIADDIDKWADMIAAAEARAAEKDATIARLREAQSFQSRVDNWMALTFSPEVRADKIERAMRFLEEATELCQAIGLPREKAAVVTDYVFGRPVGEPWQEVGGSMVTLAALCAAIEQDMAACGERELSRIDTPEMREKIAAKQVSKRLFGMVGESIEATAALGEQP